MNMFDALVRSDAQPLVPETPLPRPRQANPVRTFGGCFPVRPNRWSLSPVECEVMRLMAEEWMTPTEVAHRLCRSPKTIFTHCDRIREKMGARNQYHAIVLWDRYFRPQPVVFTVAEAI